MGLSAKYDNGMNSLLTGYAAESDNPRDLRRYELKK